VKQRITYKTAVLTHKVLTTSAPPYLHDMLTVSAPAGQTDALCRLSSAVRAARPY